jgi:L-lactate dehydrogenase complex protein LldF
MALVQIESSISQTLADPKLQQTIYTQTGRLKDFRTRSVAPDVLPEYQELREQAHALKRHTLENLDHYLEVFEENVRRRGGEVVYCESGDEVIRFIVGLAREKGLELVVKSKSMTTEEIHFNERLEPEGLEIVETDLGEFIMQLARERPYHIVAPALHKTRYDIAGLFEKQLGVAPETDPERQTQIARAVLRDRFLKAGLGVSGANFLVADSGAVVLVENEGNARLTTSAPGIHVAIAGIEKMIPRARDLAVFLKLLGRSGTGQALTAYTSFLNGPKRQGEIDGPEEFYVVLLDNGRTRLLTDPARRQSLYCIRCGACLNACPVYRKIGGHNYPWVYSGPIGKIITPQYMGVMHEPWLPFASSLCGACAEVCPVKIDIPRVLLSLRTEVVGRRRREGQGFLERAGFRLWAAVMVRPRLYRLLARWPRRLLGRRGRKGWIRTLPRWATPGPLAAWLSERDLPPPPAKSFRELWAERASRSGGAGRES